MSEEDGAGEALLRTGVIVPVRIVDEALLKHADLLFDEAGVRDAALDVHAYVAGLVEGFGDDFTSRVRRLGGR